MTNAGVVMRSTGSWYEVLLPDQRVLKCRLKGKFKMAGLKTTNPIAVGDRVQCVIEDTQAQTAIITDILPRDNYVIRQSVHKTAHGQVLAANLDQALLVATLVFPRTSLGFIDRFLVSTESFRIPTVIVFNKTDLPDADGLAYQRELVALYESLGYPCVETSVVDGTGLAAFEACLTGKITLVAGHSGVGKSSLVNAIAPHLRLRTSAVSTFANKGTHTTTFAEMFVLAPGTALIDTPGIKELGLIDVEKWEISHYFPEMRARLNECRYHNCTHGQEPGCAVLAAVESGDIALSRYHSYLSMRDADDNRR